MASKNDVLEGTQKVATEAIRPRSNLSRGPRFAQNYCNTDYNAYLILTSYQLTIMLCTGVDSCTITVHVHMQQLQTHKCHGVVSVDNMGNITCLENN